ncbi:hypothetical protein FB567DRAFT_539294 [Paraphoma chrysanthemicola]|uniref:Uncharacterized protein n=1 Tax=Paraphoma chrysanthemicola TaxID=798071 RepID=A0A8K0VT46_9PLEO|nr:hypothetical protein FB567DRAFT_539294 [Paraphoma chrysanthemicola]
MNPLSAPVSRFDARFRRTVFCRCRGKCTYKGSRPRCFLLAAEASAQAQPSNSPSLAAPSSSDVTTTIPVELMPQLDIGLPDAQPTHGHPLLAFEHKLQSRDTADEEVILGTAMVEARDRQIEASTDHKTDLHQLLSPSGPAISISAKINTLAHVAASGLERHNIHDADAHLLAKVAANTEATMTEQVILWEDQARYNLDMQRKLLSLDRRMAGLELQVLRQDARINQLEDAVLRFARRTNE